MFRKTAATLALTVGLVGIGAGAASAHECYVANRSAQGNAGASNSANWYTLHLEELFRSGHEFLGGPALTDAQVQTALAMAADQGVPSSFTLFERFTIPRSQGELAEVSSKSSDGKGIDHFFAKYGDTIVGVFFAAQAS
ncbi:MAG TPA: hypothetical protein VJN29_04280 [Intrasporangium sp.]|uniref:hypothetical protein n=1 Tax=Intrasporangium sp. TaxID=1925024 RepID=UPI002B4A6B18|nr:hypothetical protein [Intrasporangium sp.]HKX66423.1 hypothetical protein [Intrasporangium sp.]